MDKVQIYCLVLIGLNVVHGIVFDGKPRDGSHKFTATFIGLMLGLPFYGRIFGWW